MSGGPEALGDAVRRALRGEERVAAAYLFGSVARGEETGLSDVDVALVPDPGLRREQRAPRLRGLGLALGRLVPGRSFDVRFLDELPTAIRGRVVTEGILVFERDPVARVRAEVAARLDYHDFLPFEREGTREGWMGLRRRLGVG